MFALPYLPESDKRGIVRQLVDEKDIHVIAGTRSPRKAQAFKERGINSVILDLENPKTIAPALENIDRALLLTSYTVDMLRQSKRFLDTAKQTGVKHIVYIGASTAPTNEVAHWGGHGGRGCLAHVRCPW